MTAGRRRRRSSRRRPGRSAGPSGARPPSVPTPARPGARRPTRLGSYQIVSPLGAAYAPELNPDEGVWRLTKRRLANRCPADRFDLALSVIEELESCGRSPSRLRSCITRAGLRL
jgi:hypothetical protein